MSPRRSVLRVNFVVTVLVAAVAVVVVVVAAVFLSKTPSSKVPKLWCLRPI